ncbi:MAG: 5-guanidino-2-oxopentanoate decarboxylase [Geminicoccaceae bacterium]
MATCGEVLVRLLEAYGVDTVFGIPGVHTVELYRGLPATRIRHVTPRHEQGAGFMADGYARVSGKPGVCFIITGPGMTNILTAMGQAYGDSVPMLVISSVNRTEQLAMGQGRLHELRSQQAVVAGVAAFSHTVLHPNQLPEVLARAFALFASARPRPVHIEIPIDVITAPGDGLPLEARPLPGRPGPDPAAIARAAELLAGAATPLLVIGGGAVSAANEVLALAERLGAPVINTVNAKGVLPPGHALHAGENMAWPPLREALRAADTVLAVGTEFGETEMYPGPLPLRFDGKLLRIDIDPEQLVRGFPSDVPIVSDSGHALRALLAALPGSTRPAADGAARARTLREALPALWWPAVRTHQRLLGVVQEALPDAILVGDSTQPVYAGNQFFQPAAPRSWFNSSTGYGTLGYALPAAVGAKLAAPDRPVVVLVGDGGLQYTLPELAAAVEAATPVIVLVWNNRAYGEIRTYMHDHGIAPIGVDLYTPDLLAIGRGYGCAADRARDHGHLAELLAAARRRGRPSLMEVMEESPFVLE